MNVRMTLSLMLLASAVGGPAVAANPPADLCVELTAWLDQREAETAGATQPSQQAAGAQKADPGAARQRSPVQASQGGQDAGRRDLNTAVEPGREGGAVRPGGQDHPQQTSGMSAPVAQTGPGAAGPQGQAQRVADPSAPKPAQASPAKPPEPKAPPPTAQAIDQARQSAQAKDREGCRTVVRDMRLAGVAVPGPLLALAALRPDYSPSGNATQGQPVQPGPAPGVPPIPPSGVKP